MRKRQTIVTNFFKTIKEGRKIYCKNCKRIFISTHHLQFHLESVSCVLTDNKPFIKLESLEEHILVEISEYLILPYLASFITALPRLLICHGIKAVWLKAVMRTDSQAMRINKHQKFRLYNIDYFLVGLNQGVKKRCNKAYRKRLKRQIFGKVGVNTKVLSNAFY